LPFKILVVEDNLDSRNLLHFYLTTKGYAVSTAADGAEGLYLAKAEKPDVIIADLMMPELGGIEMLRQIRTEPEAANIPILIYTAFGAEASDPAKEAGARAVFNKPFDLDTMLAFISDLAEKSRNG
jgi:CheY-like chemotaxis protein